MRTIEQIKAARAALRGKEVKEKVKKEKKGNPCFKKQTTNGEHSATEVVE